MVKKVINITCLLLTFIGAVQTVYSAEDPTAPIDWTEPKVTSQEKVIDRYPLPSVQSIVCEREQNNCYAIMDNKIVYRGEVVGGYKIKSITPEKVDVTRSGKQWVLQLFPLDVKQ